MLGKKTIYGIDVKATGERIDELMKKHQLTDKALAGLLGISIQSVNKWRHGKNLPDTENLYILSRILDITIEDILVPFVKSDSIISDRESPSELSADNEHKSHNEKRGWQDG